MSPLNFPFQDIVYAIFVFQARDIEWIVLETLKTI